MTYTNSLIEAQKRIAKLIKERNHLEVQIVTRDMVIAKYQKWFKEHEHWTKQKLSTAEDTDV